MEDNITDELQSVKIVKSSSEPVTIKDHDIIATKDFNGKIQTVQADQTRGCWSVDKPCIKFLVAAGFSLAGLATGIAMIFAYPDNDTLLPIGLSLVTSNIAVWIKMPSYKNG